MILGKDDKPMILSRRGSEVQNDARANINKIIPNFHCVTPDGVSLTCSSPDVNDESLKGTCATAIICCRKLSMAT